jgi:hypothetical protein
LFDLEADPKEKKDLAESDKALFEKMVARYKEVSGTIKDVCPKMTEKLKGKKKGSKC